MFLYGGLIALVSLGFLFGVSCQSAPKTTPPAETPATESLPSASEEKSESNLAKTVTEIAIAGFAFNAASVTIPVGTTVTWTHQDSAPHTVTTRQPLFDSDTLSRNATFSYTFTEKGIFEYYCRIHPYMTGAIIVE